MKLSDKFIHDFGGAMELGWYDFIDTYRRSFFGPLWLPFQTLAFIVIITLILGRTFDNDPGLYATYVALGLLVWELVSGVLLEAPRLFSQKANLIKNVPITLSSLVVRKLVYLLCRVSFIIPLAGVIVLLFGKPLSWTALQALIAVPVLIVFSFCALTVAGYVGAYFRDLHFMMATVIRFLFFMTPIFWYGDRGARSLVALYNPFTYFIEIVRAPLMGEPASALAWAVVSVSTLAVIAMSVMLSTRFHRALIFWL